jgi:hypothetical protein
MVIFYAEVFDENARFAERAKLFPVEAFVAEASAERLDETILPGAAGLDVDGLDLVLGWPAFVRTDKIRGTVFRDGFLDEFDPVA